MLLPLRRRLSTMATGATSSPFSKAVFEAMRKLYPEDLADKSFDNTGLLLEAPLNLQAKLRNSVLLTIDLTSAVAQEAIDKKASVVIAYHPIIFRGLKQLNFANSQQTSLLRLAAEGISVYSPHTAVDAARGGNADWMADIITAQFRGKSIPVRDGVGGDISHGFGPYLLYKFPPFKAPNEDLLSLNSYGNSRAIIDPNPDHELSGHGRVVYFEKPRPLEDILTAIAGYFNWPRAFSVACAHGKSVTELAVSAAGICAGSGGSILGPLPQLDLLVTGEMSHHEVLAAVENGKSVVLLNHSNSERGYLEAVMKDKLKAAVAEEWIKRCEMYQSTAMQQGDSPAIGRLYETPDVEIVVSQMDRDPLEAAVFQAG